MREYFDSHPRHLRSSIEKCIASYLGVTRGTIRQYRCGILRVTPERAIQIEKATNGEITREDLRPDIFGKEAA